MPQKTRSKNPQAIIKKDWPISTPIGRRRSSHFKKPSNGSNHKEAHYSLGHLYALQLKYPQAEEEFREALRIDSEYSEAHNYLGQVLERQNRWPEGVEEYRRALTNPL